MGIFQEKLTIEQYPVVEGTCTNAVASDGKFYKEPNLLKYCSGYF